MKKTLSIQAIYISVMTVYLALIGCFLTLLFIRSRDSVLRGAAVGFALLIFLLGLLLLHLIRDKLVAFAETLCVCIDGMINESKDIAFDFESDTLMSKLSYRLKRLYEILLRNNERIQTEKQTIQELISDISHQVKTPIANLKMFNSTLLERQLPQEKEREFLSLMETQICKLDFLMQSLIKVSRLETGIICLKAEQSPIYDTIALALGSIVLPAEKKNIDVSVFCDPAITVPHDRKWTAEALFNLLDNAVKYTDPGGKITISAQQWEIYTKIDISDTGKGIPEEHYAQIWGRFYREDDVHDISGIGIGLYLCREIIQKQGGYIQVKSKINEGSTFSVFLPSQSYS